MVNTVMARFGTKKRNMIDFVEFCGVMEYLWSLRALNEFFMCKENIQKNLEIVYKVFETLDLDKNELLSTQELNTGLN
jgi:hypothetical protein